MNNSNNLDLLNPEARKGVLRHNGTPGVDGLYGQFPDFKSQYQKRVDDTRSIFDKAQGVISTILDTEDFAPFKHYCFTQSTHLVAHCLGDIIRGRVTYSRCVLIWSIIQPGNRDLTLILKEKHLLLCIQEEYVCQDWPRNIRWFKVLNEHEKIEIDSFRLHEALTVLADPERARQYLLARVHAIELLRSHD